MKKYKTIIILMGICIFFISQLCLSEETVVQIGEMQVIAPKSESDIELNPS